MGSHRYSFWHLLGLDACTGCRLCADFCPAVKATNDTRLAGFYRLDWQRRCFKARSGWLRLLYRRNAPDSRAWRDFAETVYRCTLCGQCQEVCPAGLSLKEMWLTLRAGLVDEQVHLPKINVIRDNLTENHNVFGEDNDERIGWVEDLDDPPEEGLVKEQAEVIYFTGCTAAFFPLAQRIPIALVEIFAAAGVDFTLLGSEEWCCGFPLLGAGLPEMVQESMDHNLAAVRAKRANTVVFACPSCYLMWKEHYPPEFRLVHATEYLDELLSRRRLSLKPQNQRVTYHDPCDLGRGGRVFEAPRRVIRALPGVTLLEMFHNRERCSCCGGGGNLEMIDPELSAKIAGDKIAQARATGAQTIVTSCQQCVRTMATFVRRNNIDLAVLDLSQLVRRAMV